MARNEAAFDVRAKDKFSTVFDKLSMKLNEIEKKGAQGFAIGAAAGATSFALSKLGDVAGSVFDKTIGGAMRFQREMLNVNSITHASKGQLEDMGNSVLKIGGDFGQSAETMAKGLYDISSSGFQGADAISILGTSAKAATAGLAETSDAASGIVAVLNAYGMSAKDATHVSDVLFQTVNRGVVTFPELSAEIGKTTALAAPLGVSLEEVGAGLSVMTRHGIDAENATTQLNAIMSSMLQPSAQAAGLAKDLGIQWNTAGLRAKGLSGTLSDMIAKTGGNQEQMAILLGDVRAIRGAFTLAGDSGREFAKELDIMTNSAGALDDAFSVQKQGLAFKSDQLGTKWDNLATKAGTVLIPALDNVVSASLGLTDSFDKAGDSSLSVEDRLGGLAQGLNDLNPATWGQQQAWAAFQQASADASAAAEDDVRHLAKTAENASGGFVSSSKEMSRSLSVLADRSDILRGHVTKLTRKTDDLVSEFKDATTWAEKAGDAIAEASYGPEELRLKFGAVKDELKDNETELRKTAKAIKKLHDDGKPVPVDLKKKFNDLKLSVNEGKQEVIRLGTKLVGTGAISLAQLRAQFSKLDIKIDTTNDRAAALYYKLLQIRALSDLGTAYDNATGGHHRAIGGAVQSGETYLVGEKGPELFSPSMSGYIVPNNQLQGGGHASMTPAWGGGGDVYITVPVSAALVTPGGAEALARQIVPLVTKAMQRQQLVPRR